MNGAGNWRLSDLGDLVSFRTGKLNSNAATPAGRYPFFTCSRETFRTDTFAFDEEAVLLAGNNAAGVYPIKYYNGRFDAYQRTYIIVSLDLDRLTNRFLFYALQPQLERLKSLSTGAATKFLTLTILRSLKLRIPPLPIQKRIAAILSAYDDLIEVNTRRIAILEEMARRIYEEWFVHYRFPGGDGALPSEWELSTVRQAFTITGGGTPSRKQASYWEGGDIEWYSPTDLTRAKTAFMEGSAERITELGLSKSSAKLFPAHSVMMTSRATIGAIAINATPATTNQGFITCLPNEDVPLYFLYHWLKWRVPEFERLATGATFKELSKGVFKTLSFTVPSRDVVDAFEDKVGPMMELVRTLDRQNTNLRAQRDLLLPRLVSGKLDVSTLDAAEEELTDA